MKLFPIRHILTCTIVCLIFGCNGYTKETTFDEKTDLEISSERGLKIKLFDKASNFFILSQEDIINNQEHLIFCNSFPSDPNLLFFTNLKDESKSFSLDFEVEGPNGVGQMSEFYFHNFDSIFIFNRYSYNLSLVDSSGKVKRRYLLRESTGKNPNENTALSWVSNKSKVFIKNDNLYIPTFPDKDPYHDGYLKENLLLNLNLSSGEMKSVLGYPSKYKSGGYWGGAEHILPSVTPTFDPNILVVSYPIEDSIFHYNIQENLLKPFSIGKSKLVNNIEPKSSFTTDRLERLKYQLGTDYYFSIIFDSHRNLYYRFASQKYSDESIVDIINNKSANSNINSLLVFDSDMRFKKEYYLPTNSNGYQYFVFKSGVYIVSDNEEEDVLSLHSVNSF